MAKFTQICASHDDLFALDEDGNVVQYNFNTKTWVRLAGSPSPNGPILATSALDRVVHGAHQIVMEGTNGAPPAPRARPGAAAAPANWLDSGSRLLEALRPSEERQDLL